MADRQDDNVLQVRRDIDRTTAEMHETIDAIRRKLDPDHLKHQAQDAVREATIGRAEDTMSKAMGKAEDAVNSARDTAVDTGSGIMDTIRQNPIPAALAGIGLGWLLMNRSPSERSSGHFDRTQPYYGGYGRPGPHYGEPPTRRTATSDFSYQGSRSSFQGQSKTEGEGPLNQIADKAGETREAAAEMMNQVRSKTGDIMGNTGEMAMSRGSGLIDAIRENPIPAAITGVGLGWLFMNSGSRSEQRYGPDYSGKPGFYERTYKGYPEEDRGAMDQVRSTVGDTMTQAQETVGDLAGRAQETVGDLAGRAQETVGSATGRVQGTVGDVSDRVQQQVGEMAQQTRHQYSRVEDRFQETLSSNPLAVGAAAIAVGAVAAMMMPATHQERRFMGEARDSLMEQVQSTAEDTMQKVQRVAGQMQETAKTEAKEEGLTQ